MKKVRQFANIFLALLILYSSVGQAMISHCCEMKAPACESSCCCNDMEQTTTGDLKNIIIESQACCNINECYIINPFSVCPPETLKAKINQADVVSVLLATAVNNIFSLKVTTGFFGKYIDHPPQYDLLAFMQLFLI